MVKCLKASQEFANQHATGDLLDKAQRIPAKMLRSLTYTAAATGRLGLGFALTGASEEREGFGWGLNDFAAIFSACRSCSAVIFLLKPLLVRDICCAATKYHL